MCVCACIMTRRLMSISLHVTHFSSLILVLLDSSHRCPYNSVMNHRHNWIQHWIMWLLAIRNLPFVDCNARHAHQTNERCENKLAKNCYSKQTEASCTTYSIFVLNFLIVFRSQSAIRAVLCVARFCYFLIALRFSGNGSRTFIVVSVPCIRFDSFTGSLFTIISAYISRNFIIIIVILCVSVFSLKTSLTHTHIRL